MSLITQYGLPTKWAVQIYLTGINSRKVASELASKLDEPENTSRLSYVATYLERFADDIQHSDAFSPLAKEWISVQLIRPVSKTASIPVIHQFSITGEGADKEYDRLLCKKYDGQTYLCSVDLKYRVRVNDGENLPFSQVTDIPGVFFSRKETGWTMECHNPYVEVKY